MPDTPPPPQTPPADDALTVAVCTVGRPALTRALSMIVAGDTSTIHEIIVVDNTAGTLDRAHVHDACAPVHARILNGSGPASVGRNLALSHAQTDVVLFLDDDCLPDPAWAKEMAHYMASNPGLAAAFGKVVPVPVPGWELRTAYLPRLGENAWGVVQGEDGERWCPAVSAPSWTPGPVRGEPTVPWCVVGSSNNLALRRSRLPEGRPAFLPHLGPGTGAGSGEDTELGYLLMREGRGVAYAPWAQVQHDSWMSPASTEPAHRGYIRGNVEALGHHAVRGDQHAAGLLAAYLGHFRADNGFGLTEFGEVLEWAYGSFTGGSPRAPLRKSDLS
ncbi:glycosyltransferase family A protein [Streptomyces sp. NPDC001904]|uniref:glycosyltransferase family A protein n=1 Tax=Streptomyces sp. NPDC001904 TaxID=3154531 RepID=UPI00332CD631